METRNLSIALPAPLHRRLLRQCRVLTQRTGLTTRSQVVRLALAEWLERAETGAGVQRPGRKTVTTLTTPESAQIIDGSGNPKEED